MSRHAAATTAGRARDQRRRRPPRRVSGPAVPNRRDGQRPGEGAGSDARGEPARGAPGGHGRGAPGGRGARAASARRARAPSARRSGARRAHAACDGSTPARLRMPPTPRSRRQPRVYATPRPRRASGAARPQRLAYGGVAIASRVAGVAVDVSASRAMDRLVRGRVWIAIIAFGLIGPRLDAGLAAEAQRGHRPRRADREHARAQNPGCAPRSRAQRRRADPAASPRARAW